MRLHQTSVAYVDFGLVMLLLSVFLELELQPHPSKLF